VETVLGTRSLLQYNRPDRHLESLACCRRESWASNLKYRGQRRSNARLHLPVSVRGEIRRPGRVLLSCSANHQPLTANYS
jgi:hypothetical protein